MAQAGVRRFHPGESCVLAAAGDAGSGTHLARRHGQTVVRKEKQRHTPMRMPLFHAG